MSELIEKALQALAPISEAEFERSGYSDAMSVRSLLAGAAHAGNEREVALQLRAARRWLPDLIPDDIQVPAAPPKVEEPPDPLEVAYDRGAEARANGIDRDDNPYAPGDKQDAWEQGWEEAKA